MRKSLIICLLVLVCIDTSAQEVFNLEKCLDYAIENNLKLQKDKLARETAYQSKREVIGALLPQISASTGITDNIQKTRIIMPNFLNGAMGYEDPNADKYLTVVMGTDLNANWGFKLSQQIMNFSIYNAIGIAKTAQEIAQTGVQITTQETIAQASGLYFNVQVLTYAIEQFDKSIGIMHKTRDMMGVLNETGIVRKVDADQIQVTVINLETQKTNLKLALDVQKKLLKLQMGFDVNKDIILPPIDLDEIESLVYSESANHFEIQQQLPFKMIKQQQQMLNFQRKAAVSEVLPAIVLTGTYSHNYLGDDFKGPTYQHFPVSMVALNLKMPLFTGLSKNAKIKKADIEIKKAQIDEQQLVQSITMGYSNAKEQLYQSRSAVDAQRKNKDLAEEVMYVTEQNYSQGLSSLSDMLNANSSLIQAQMNYVDALNTCVKAYIDLKKVDGTIQELYK